MDIKTSRCSLEKQIHIFAMNPSFFQIAQSDHMSRRGGNYVPIAATGIDGSGGAGAGAGAALGASIGAIAVSVAVAIVMSILIANLTGDVSRLTTNLNTTGTMLRAVEELVMEVAETGSINITYDLIETGTCYMLKGCYDDLPNGQVEYTAPLNIYLAYAGPIVSVVAEIAPFDQISAKKRDAVAKPMTNQRKVAPYAEKVTKKHRGRAPIQPDNRDITCDYDNPVYYDSFGISPVGAYVLRFPSAAQLANFYFNDTGPSGGVLETYLNLDIPRQSYYIRMQGFTTFDLSFYFYPSPNFCAGFDTFDFRAPTKFTLVSGLAGSSGQGKRAVAAMRKRVSKGGVK